MLYYLWHIVYCIVHCVIRVNRNPWTKCNIFCGGIYMSVFGFIVFLINISQDNGWVVNTPNLIWSWNLLRKWQGSTQCHITQFITVNEWMIKLRIKCTLLAKACYHTNTHTQALWFSGSIIFSTLVTLWVLLIFQHIPMATNDMHVIN